MLISPLQGKNQSRTAPERQDTPQSIDVNIGFSGRKLQKFRMIAFGRQKRIFETKICDVVYALLVAIAEGKPFYIFPEPL